MIEKRSLKHNIFIGFLGVRINLNEHCSWGRHFMKRWCLGRKSVYMVWDDLWSLQHMNNLQRTFCLNGNFQQTTYCKKFIIENLISWLS